MSNVYKKGDNHPYIAKIQKALNDLLGLSLVPDGDYGAKTEAAVRQWQVANKVAATGVYVDQVAQHIDTYISRRYLKEEDFDDAAKKLNVEKACIKAVQEVESSGSGFAKDGKLVILFERHVFKRELDKKLKANEAFAKQIASKLGIKQLGGQTLVSAIQTHLLSTHPNTYNTATGGYSGGSAEWGRLNKAVLIDPDAAYRSASWGLFQIMGYHCNILGFKNVDEMVNFYNASERNQLLSFCDFVKYDPRLIKAIREKDWLTFARAYNGPAQKGYDQRLAAAYKKHKAA